MATRKTVDQILDGAADILEKHGWVTEQCYDADLGGYCALGAIAQAVFPKHPKTRIGDRAYPLGRSVYNDRTAVDPRHAEAVEFLAKRLVSPNTVKVRKTWGYELIRDDDVYYFNDSLPSGCGVDWATDKNVVKDEKLRLKSSRKVVQKLRSAAKAYRKQQEKLAAKAA